MMKNSDMVGGLEICFVTLTCQIKTHQIAEFYMQKKKNVGKLNFALFSYKILDGADPFVNLIQKQDGFVGSYSW